MKDLYENITSPSIERYFVTLSHSGRTTKIILIWREKGKDAWNVRFDAMYTHDLKQAKEGTSTICRYLGKIDFDSAIVEMILDGKEHLESKPTNEEPILEAPAEVRDIPDDECIECGKKVSLGTMQDGHLCMSCYEKRWSYCR